MSGREATYAIALVVLSVVTLVFLGSLCQRRHAEAPLPPPATERQDFRPSHALSLRMLQARIRRAGGGLPGAADLAGLNVIDGLMIEADGEVILLGRTEPNLPRLSIHDFAIALRNAYVVEPVYNDDPGCTIDPRVGAPDPFEIQVVKVFGMPHNCPMAARFVALDYELKRISSGIAILRPEVRSLYELHRLGTPFCQGHPGEMQNVESVHRFWFYPRLPQSPRYLEHDSIVWIRKPVHVQLLTERQFLDASGKSTGSAAADPAADEFARSISKILLTNEVAPYIQLRNDFRLIELARIIRYKQVPAEELGYLLRDHPIPAENVPSYVGEIRREERGEVVCESHVAQQDAGSHQALVHSVQTQQYHHRSRGGVSAAVPVQHPDFNADVLPVLEHVQRRVRDSRPAASEFFWEIRY